MVIVCISTYLMVPVGEGSGEPKALMCSSCCCIVGILILSGDMCGRRGRGSRGGCSLSLCSSGSRSDKNWILITVLGKRNIHLKRRIGRAEMVERAGQEKEFDYCLFKYIRSQSMETLGEGNHHTVFIDRRIVYKHMLKILTVTALNSCL